MADVLNISDESLHQLARTRAAAISDIDRKQLRFNDIVDTAKRFYLDAADGVTELVDSTSRTSPLYDKKAPMWAALQDQYAWMALDG